MRLIYVRSSQIRSTEDGVDDTSLIQAAHLVAHFGAPSRLCVDRGTTRNPPALHQLVGCCVCNPQPADAGAEVCARDLSRFGRGAQASAVVEQLARVGYRVRFAETHALGPETPIV